MKFHQWVRVVSMAVFAAALCLLPARARSQAQTTGGIAGVITDPSGGAVPGAILVAVNDNNGAAQTARTDAHGNFRFALLPPSTYTLTITKTGFRTVEQKVIVQLGQDSTASVKLSVASATQTVEVIGAAPPLLQTENGNVANTISETQVQRVPVPGGDLNYLAQLAPGAVNTGGLFPSMFGMPTSSNMYTLDGMEDIDPYNNGTNGGATNLLLGINEVQEATTVSSGYSGKYGTLAGSNVNIVTKSGGNAFHGNAVYHWNGDKLNANNFFNNAGGTPRPVSIANQWAGSLGGPIIKNKLFFFVDDEGLAVVLPASQQTLIPSPAFETATLANLTANHPNSVNFYKTIFNLYNGAAGASRATPVAGSCGTLAVTAGAPCTLQFQSNANNFAWENITTAKVDWNASASDHLYVHWLLDRGVQSTGIDPINPVFNEISKQPEFQTQIFWSHTFGSSAVNALTLATQHYTAIFGPPSLSAALAAFPTQLDFNDGSLTTLGGGDASANGGRSVTRLQVSDDFSKTLGEHGLEFGFTGSKYLANTRITRDVHGDLETHSLDSFYNGGLDPSSKRQITSYAVSFPAFGEAPLRMMRLGGYANDQWRLSPTLSLTLSLRVDHPTSPSCATNCYSGMSAGFLNASHDANQPYNAAITTGLSNAIGNLSALEWQPRIGFAWQPWGGNSGTVVRGGFGVFADNFPISIGTGFLSNLPLNPAFRPNKGLISPDESNSLIAQAQAAYLALKSGFANGATLAQLQAAVPGFQPPALTSVASPLLNPYYYKWNLEVQHSLWHNAALKLGYNGNAGRDELMQNGALNAYAANFAGLPSAPLDARFNQVTVYQSNGTSNYNGLTTVFHDNFSQGVLQLTYTWGHDFDEGFGTGQTRTVEFPNDLAATYGPADQDVRHVFNANYVWNVPFQQWLGGGKALAGGWQLSGTFMARTGLPYSILDQATSSTLGNTGFAANLLANFLGGPVTSCGNPDQPCLTKAQFTSASAGFGDQQRNLFRAPGFWDTDFTVRKDFTVPGWESGQFHFAVSAYNLFNHPNFRTPNTNLGSSFFGQLTRTAQNASSILGDNGGDASPRIVQLELGITF